MTPYLTTDGDIYDKLSQQLYYAIPCVARIELNRTLQLFLE